MLLRETSNSVKTKDSRIGRPPPRATIMCPCSVLKAFRTNQCKSLNPNPWNMTLKKYEKSFKKNSGVSCGEFTQTWWKKPQKWAIFYELVGTFFFGGQKKIGSIPLVAPEISWVAFAPSEPVAPKRLVGIHCSVIEMGTAWDFAHCLTVEVPNSMHPGGEKPAFRSERSAANNNKTHRTHSAASEDSQTSAQGWGNWQQGADPEALQFQLVMIVPPRMDIPSYKAVVDNVLHDVC